MVGHGLLRSHLLPLQPGAISLHQTSILGDLHLSSSFRDHFLHYDGFRSLYRNLEIGHLQALASSWSGLSSLVRLPDNCSPNNINTLAEVSQLTNLLQTTGSLLISTIKFRDGLLPSDDENMTLHGPWVSGTDLLFLPSWKGPTCNLYLNEDLIEKCFLLFCLPC